MQTFTQTLKLSMIITVLLLSFFSCNKENQVKKVPLQVSEALKTDTNFVGLNLAGVAASEATSSRLIKGDIVSSKAGNMANSKAVLFSPSIKILDSLILPDNINPSLYIFNYVGGGYVIIAADKRVEPILAFSPTGYFPHSGNTPSALGSWLTTNHKNMQLLRSNKGLTQPDKVAKMWAELSNTTALMNQNRARLLKAAPGSPGGPPVPTCQDTYSTYYSPVLLQTNWGQGYPYNYLINAGTYDNGHRPTGCVATSIAQVMYYWKYPTRYNWAIMPLNTYSFYSTINYPGNRDVAQLMLDVGTSVQMQYFDSGSYPSIGSVLPPRVGPISNSTALKNSFGYKNGTDNNYNSSIVQSDIDRRYPVILGGTVDNTNLGFFSFGEDGHQWVCDGYYTYTYTGCPGELILGYTNLYLHMNWGWDGRSNGYFGFNNWAVWDGSRISNYQNNQVMTYNIHP